MEFEKTHTMLNEEACQSLIAIMRQEIQEYGGLLNLLKEQQKSILERDTRKIVELIEKTNFQFEAMNHLHEKRGQILDALGERFNIRGLVRVSALMPFCSDAFFGLLDALSTEIQSLVLRAQDQVEQNQVLLNSVIRYAEDMVKTIYPEIAQATYNKKGVLKRSGSVGFNASV